MINVLLLHAGHSLQCFSCQSPDGQLYSPDQCEQIQVIDTCIDGNYTCGNYRAKTTESNVTTEVQHKGCFLEDDCSVFSQQCNEIVTNGGVCEFSCCQQDFCNEGKLKCYHCDGPFPNASLGLNSSSALNQSYTAAQCISEQREVSCRNRTCSRFYRRFVNEDDVEVEVELRSCFSSAECTKVNEFCRDIESEENSTAICKVLCCDTHLCNTASRGEISSLFIALEVMFAVFHL